jgi:hypothetical protein
MHSPWLERAIVDESCNIQTVIFPCGGGVGAERGEAKCSARAPPGSRVTPRRGDALPPRGPRREAWGGSHGLWNTASSLRPLVREQSQLSHELVREYPMNTSGLSAAWSADPTIPGPGVSGPICFTRVRPRCPGSPRVRGGLHDRLGVPRGASREGRSASSSPCARCRARRGPDGPTALDFESPSRSARPLAAPASRLDS